MIPFDRFTERAQDVISSSQDILRRYSHNQMDTEHVFLALLEQSDGIAGAVLEEMLGVNIDLVAMQLDEYLANNRKLNVPGRAGSGQIYVTPRIQRLGQVALGEAQSMGDDFISTEHLLLAIASEERGHSARLLTEAGVDKEDVRLAMHDLLVGWGHRVELAADGLEGLRCILDTRPDVALVDIAMPGLDGYSVARRVRAQLGDQGPRLIALTGFGREEDRERAHRAGFDSHLTKPATPRDLRRVLRSYTDGPARERGPTDQR